MNYLLRKDLLRALQSKDFHESCGFNTVWYRIYRDILRTVRSPTIEDTSETDRT